MFLDYLGWFKNCVDQHIDKFMFFSLHRFRIDKEEKIGNTQERKQYKCCSHSLSELEGTNLSYYYILIFRILYIYGVDIKGVLHIFSWTFFCLALGVETSWGCVCTKIVCVKFTVPKVCTVGIYSTYEYRYLYSLGEYICLLLIVYLKISLIYM